MTDSRDTKRVVERYLEGLRTPGADRVDAKVLPDALAAMHKAKLQTAPCSRFTWRMVMTSRTGGLIAAALVVAVVSFAVLDSFTQPAWALADALEALKDYRAVHIVGAFPGGTAEAWIRGNDAGTRSTDVVVRGSHGAITWTKEGSTYHYEPGQNTVYFEDALTVGMTPWLGRELLEMLGTADTAKVIHGKDPATGRDRVTLMCSLTDVHGPQSWIMNLSRLRRGLFGFSTSNTLAHYPQGPQSPRSYPQKQIPIR
ncbi:MAG: hypothetical protein FJ280_20245 [Planctomycetes bacterium]|nr:hypothetical protein [Planctomycetota bacterium]